MDSRTHYARYTFTTIIAIFAASLFSTADASPRLKYRSKQGVCACTSGLSESDISRAMSGLDRLDKPQDTVHAESENRNEQPTRREDDAAVKPR